MRALAVLSSLLLLPAGVAMAETPAESVAIGAERPRIALVLSGGGARGAAHAGILQILESHRVPVDIVVGTSFGALVGGLYASGLSPEEITDWLEQLDWTAAASDRPARRALSVRRKQDDYSYALRYQIGYRDGRFILPRGLLGAQGLSFMLRERTLHAARWQGFDDYPIRFRAVATDMERGEPVVLRHGSLADAMVASMAVPGVVAPMEIDGRILVDGGLVDNLPVGVARALGADIIIAVDISTPLAPRGQLDSIFGVSAQVVNMLGMENQRRAVEMLGPDDILIRPDLSGITATDFELMGEAVRRGLAAAPTFTHRLQPHSLGEEEWAEWTRHQRVDDRDMPVIDFIEIDNPTPMPDEIIRARVRMVTGVPLDVTALRRDIDDLYSIGEFERIDYEVVTRDGRQGLRITVTPNEIGPNYLRFGLNIQDDLQGGAAYNLLFMHTRTQINQRNGEWRNEFQIGETQRAATELFQPLTWRGDLFIRPRVDWSRTSFDLFDAGGNRTARYGLSGVTVTVDLGYQWDNIGEIVIGGFTQSVDAAPTIGDPALPGFDERIAGWQWRMTIDQLDSWTFPADAWYVELSGRHADTSLAGDRDFSRVTGTALRAWPVTDNDRIVVGVFGGGRIGGDLPLYEEYPLGGFLSLSGLRRDALRGSYVLASRLIWYRSVFRLPAGFGDRLYVGLSHERGNVWDDRDAVSLGDLRWGSSAFVGADLFIGALYLGFGYADDGTTAGYLFLQRSFR